MFACHQYAYSQNAAGPGAERAPWTQSTFRHGPPPIVAILGVGAAFMLFPPLGLAALAFVLWRARHGGGSWRQGFTRDGAPWRQGRPMTSNSAFEERRRETLTRLAEEGEAFNEFERRRHEAREREAFDRFMAERAAKAADGKPGDSQPSA
jgi:hypothetical protein